MGADKGATSDFSARIPRFPGPPLPCKVKQMESMDNLEEGGSPCEHRPTQPSEKWHQQVQRLSSSELDWADWHGALPA